MLISIYESNITRYMSSLFGDSRWKIVGADTDETVNNDGDNEVEVEETQVTPDVDSGESADAVDDDPTNVGGVVSDSNDVTEANAGTIPELEGASLKSCNHIMFTCKELCGHIIKDCTKTSKKSKDEHKFTQMLDWMAYPEHRDKSRHRHWTLKMVSEYRKSKGEDDASTKKKDFEYYESLKESEVEYAEFLTYIENQQETSLNTMKASLSGGASTYTTNEAFKTQFNTRADIAQRCVKDCMDDCRDNYIRECNVFEAFVEATNPVQVYKDQQDSIQYRHKEDEKKNLEAKKEKYEKALKRYNDRYS